MQEKESKESKSRSIIHKVLIVSSIPYNLIKFAKLKNQLKILIQYITQKETQSTR